MRILRTIICLLLVITWTAKAAASHPENRDPQLGKTITLTGTAQNAKLGAVLLVDGDAIYLKDKNAWEPEILNQKVQVKGILQKYDPPVAEKKNGEWSAGVSENSRTYRLENIKWELVP